MKKRYLFIQGASKWNKTLSKFIKLSKRIKINPNSTNLVLKLEALYKKLEKMQYRVGIKVAGTAIAIMLTSATSFAQDFDTPKSLTYAGAIDVGTNSAPEFADIDGDGDIDMLCGNNQGTFILYKNDGNGNFIGKGPLMHNGTEIDFGYSCSPALADIDEDGDVDLYGINDDDFIQVYKNDGSGNFTPSANFQVNGSDFYIQFANSLTFADLDDDGDLDLFVGNSDGTIVKFTNNDGDFSFTGNLQANGSNINVEDYPQMDFVVITATQHLQILTKMAILTYF